MKIGIAGYTNTGKTTIFNALTKGEVQTTAYSDTSTLPHVGVVKVPDGRIDTLSKMYEPKKTIYADVEYIDIVGIAMGSARDEKTVRILNHIKDVDALIQIVRSFKNDNVPHVKDKIDPVSDASNFELELILRDLELVENRLDRIELSLKKTADKKPLYDEKDVLLKCKETLEDEHPLRQLELNEDEKKLIKNYQFLSMCPEIVVLNVGEDDIKSEETKSTMDALEHFYKGKNTKVACICAKIEEEIAQLDKDEAAMFLEDLQIDEPALNKLIHLSYDLLGLIPFFTVGKDEVRAWTVRQNTTALKAAGKIHSDIERGFIRAEVISYDDFIGAGDMVKAKEKGTLRLEGKGYIVKDGDIINFRFNV
jgi:GTP-binding protein YchF